MRSVEKLPEGYQEILRIDLQKNRKTALLVNGICVAIMVVMLIIPAFFVSYGSVFIEDLGEMSLWIKLAVMLVGLVAYIILHEAVHAVVMRCFCTAKVRFGFTGMYAFAGSEGYYCKRHYVVIALAPILVWGVVLGIVNAFVPVSWFYVVYFIQVMNISGAAGDLYVSWIMKRLPKDILVQDSGTAMIVFSKES